MSILIKRNQVDGLVAMKALLDQIDASYPASKVTTTVAKTVEAGQDPANYTGQELLAELKTNVDSILDGGDGLNLPELKRLIDKLNAELNGGTYADTEGDDVTLNGLKNKQINDVVRISFTYNGSTATPVDASQITNALTAGQTLYAYTESGAPIVDDTGESLSFDFDTKTFLGSSPYILDVDATKASGGVNPSTGQPVAGEPVYTPFTGIFKVFPVGTWTLEDLPADALLDNNEMQLIAYDQALQKVIIQLATDKNLIDRITEAVGETAIQDAVKANTATIDARLDRLEGTDVSDLSKVAVKVDRIVGTPSSGTQGEQDYVAAETITKNTQIASKAYIDAVDNEIKADIGAANAATSYDANGKVAVSTVRGEINSVKAKMVYKDSLVQTVKTSVTDANEDKQTDDQNTISETALVQKFVTVDSNISTNATNLYNFINSTAPATYVNIQKVTDTFSKLNAVSNVYQYTYTDSTHPEVVGYKLFSEKISEILDSMSANDSVAYKFANIQLAPAVEADAATGITAKNAETGPVADNTPVLSAQYTRNLITNEQERAIKRENDIDAKTYDFSHIVVDDGTAVDITTSVTSFDAENGTHSTANVTTTVVAARTPETLSETTAVWSKKAVEVELNKLDRSWQDQVSADKTELLNRIAYERVQTEADIQNLDDKTIDIADIQTSAGISAQIVHSGTLFQDTVSAEAAASGTTKVTSKQYVDDAVKVAEANAKRQAYIYNQALDNRVDAIEAITPVTERLTVVIDDSDESNVIETITLSQSPILNTVNGRDHELVILVNGISYFYSDGVYTLSGNDNTTVTWNAVGAGFTLREVLDPNQLYVIAKYRYNNATMITPIQGSDVPVTP